MKILIPIFFAFTIAAFFADWLLANPGHILIYHGGSEFRMTLAFAIVALTLIFLFILGALFVFKKVISFPSRYKRSLQWKSREQFVKAFLADISGDNSAAERLYLRGAKHGLSADAHFIAAAKIAHENGNTDRRDKLVASAIKLGGAESLALVKRAQWFMEEGEYGRAESLINKIPDLLRTRPMVLRLRADLCYEKGDFNQLISLLPKLSSRKVFDESRLETLRISAYSSYILDSACQGDLAKIKTAWRKIPRKLKKSNQILATYVGVLFKERQYLDAEKLLRKRIQAEWDSHLVALYGEVRTDAPQKILKNLEDWGRNHQDDAGLGIARARQFMQAGMWGQARGAVSTLLERNPSPTLYKLLADIDERLGDSTRSLSNRKAGLELAATLTPDDPQVAGRG